MSAPAPCPKCDRDLVPSAVREEHWCPGGCGYLRDGVFTEYGSEKTNGSPTVELCVRTQSSDPPPIGEVLDELAAFVRRFVVMSPAQADAIALWIAHTHCFDAAEQTPYLAISSAEKRSGKTRLLEVLELLVARPWLTGRVTAAVLARKVDAERPTLLLDESDAAFKGEKEYAEALRGLLNTGHRRGGKSTVCVGQGAEISYKDFSTFCAKAIAGIGKLPDTVADRSLPIRLERRAPYERAERFRRRDVEAEVEPLRDALAKLGDIGMIVELEVARPDLPAELDDRAQDAAEPLLAIADRAGDEWPARARRALVELHGGREIDDESVGVRLLADIQNVFGDRDRLASSDLLGGLHGLDEAPWGDWYGKPLSARALAKMLKPYGVHSRTVRFDDDSTAKGFLSEQFEGAWSRYIPGSPPSKGHKVTNRSGSGIEPDSETSQEPLCDGLKSAANPHGERDVTDVTDRDVGEAAEAELERLREKGLA
jgi:Protein of unknown function (DUF3631)